jgi:ketosteroid isomerase-like protein
MQDRTEESRAMDSGSVVRRLYEAFAAWDLEVIAELLSDGVVFHVPGTGVNAGDHRGRDEVFAFLEQAASPVGPISQRTGMWRHHPVYVRRPGLERPAT